MFYTSVEHDNEGFWVWLDILDMIADHLYPREQTKKVVVSHLNAWGRFDLGDVETVKGEMTHHDTTQPRQMTV